MPTPKPPSDSRPSLAPAASPVTRRPLRPLRWLKSLLKGRLRLERRGLHIHLLFERAVLEDAADEPTVSGGEALRQAHSALRALLDRHADARRTLRHLVYVEEMIARSGSRALKKIPTPVLRKAQSQLELLTRASPQQALVALQERMARALHGRRNDSGASTRPQALHVSEATHSLFDEEERRWTDQMPLDPPVTDPRRP